MAAAFVVSIEISIIIVIVGHLAFYCDFSVLMCSGIDNIAWLATTMEFLVNDKICFSMLDSGMKFDDISLWDEVDVSTVT